jgi:hypothetical protein
MDVKFMADAFFVCVITIMQLGPKLCLLKKWYVLFSLITYLILGIMQLQFPYPQSQTEKQFV